MVDGSLLRHSINTEYCPSFVFEFPEDNETSIYFAATGHSTVPQTSPFTRVENILSLIVSNNEHVDENLSLNNLQPEFEMNGFKPLLVVVTL